MWQETYRVKNIDADRFSKNGATHFLSSYPQVNTPLKQRLVQSLVVITLNWMSPNLIKFPAAISSTFKCSYEAVQQTRFVAFCFKVDTPPLPVNKNTLCRFVASLADDGLHHQTIKCSPSAVRQCTYMYQIAYHLSNSSAPSTKG